MFFLRRIDILLLFILICGLPVHANAQEGIDWSVDTKPPRGLMPNSEQLSSPVDNIDMFSGNLHIQIPVGALPRGRGGSEFSLNLVYNSNLYDTQPEKLVYFPPYPQEAAKVPVTYLLYQNGGWSLGEWYRLEADVKRGEDLDNTSSCPAEDARRYRLRVVLPDGSLHVLHLEGHGDAQGDGYNGNGFFGIHPLSGNVPLADDGTGNPNYCFSHWGWETQTGTLRYYTSDGSFLRVEIDVDGSSLYTGWRLFLPDGSVVENGSKLTDANGNSIKKVCVCEASDPGNPPYDCETGKFYCAFRDDPFDENENPRREIQIRWDTEIENYEFRDDVVTSPGPNGEVKWTIHSELFQVSDSGRKYYIGGGPPDDPQLQVNLSGVVSSVYAVRNLQLPFVYPPEEAPPEWYSYEFDYAGLADNGYGQLKYMRVPSGAEYNYEYFLQGQFPMDYTDSIAHENRVVRKTITHDGRTDEWKFHYPLWTASPLVTGNNTVENPDGSKISYRKGSLYGGANRIIEWEGTGDAPIINRVTKRKWAQNKAYDLRSGINHNENNPYIEKESVTVKDVFGNLTKSFVSKFSYNKNGNLLSRTDYADWIPYRGLDVNDMEPDGTDGRTTEYEYFVNAGEASSDVPDVNAYWNGSWSWPHRLNAVKRRTIKADSATYAATEFEYDNPYAMGNVIAEKRWDNPVPSTSAPEPLGPGNSLILIRDYDNEGWGNLTDIYEPEVRTHAEYDDNGNVVTHLYQAYGTNEQRSTQYTWFNKVAVESKTDLENSITTSYTYDVAGRQTSVLEAGLKQTQTYYDDEHRMVTVRSDLRSFGDGLLQTITAYDMLGRVKHVQTSDGPAILNSDGSPILDPYGEIIEANGINVKTIDARPSGNYVITSTPYRSLGDPTLEWTCTKYDKLGRVAAVAMFKGSSAPANCNQTTNRTGFTETEYGSAINTGEYNGYATTVTDPAGKTRKQITDALGRLVEVIEDPGGLNYSTAYEYDPLDNLISAKQDAQERTFEYSTLSRLLSATNPESGTITYTYNDRGDLETRMDMRGIMSTLTYDSLHRIRTKEYNDSTPMVTYNYYLYGSTAPNVGRLQSVISGVATTVYDSYDALGNVTGSTHIIDGYSGNLAFNYDWYLNGGLAGIQYPSGRIVDYDIDDAGRTEKVYAGSRTFADLTPAAGIPYPCAYAPDGRLAQMKLGNDLYATREYRTPGTPTVYKLGASFGIGDLLELRYNFSAQQNNGNLISQEIIRDSNPLHQNYSYDGVNRLVTAEEVDGFRRSFGYDRYGNRWVDPSSDLINSREKIVQAANFALKNQMDDVQYDGAGNQVTYDGYSLEYDAEGRVNKVKIGTTEVGTYTYDGDGRRVKKVWTEGTPATTYFVYNALGQLAAEYSTETPAATGITYPFTDMLGSVRAVTSKEGDVLECYDYLPFGRMLSAGDNGRSGCFPTNPDVGYHSSLSQKFTGKERDAETGLDYFGARYLSSAQGRWMSVDPVTITKDRMRDPQRLNLYAYVRNSPLNAIDRDGRYESWMHEIITENLLRFANDAGGIEGRQIPENRISAIATLTGDGPGGADSPEFRAASFKNIFDGTAEKLHFPSEKQMSSALSDLPGQIQSGDIQKAAFGMHSIEDGKGAHAAFAGKGFLGMVGHVAQSGLSRLGLATDPDKIIGDKKFVNMANAQYQTLIGDSKATLSKAQLSQIINLISIQAQQKEQEIKVKKDYMK